MLQLASVTRLKEQNTISEETGDDIAPAYIAPMVKEVLAFRDEPLIIIPVQFCYGEGYEVIQLWARQKPNEELRYPRHEILLCVQGNRFEDPLQAWQQFRKGFMAPRNFEFVAAAGMEPIVDSYGHYEY